MSVDPRILEMVGRWEESREQGRTLTAEELCVDCPDLLPALREQLRRFQSLDSLLTSDGRAADECQPADAAVIPRVAGYEILGILGQGGMAVVYKARQVGLGRLVALKMILAGAHASASHRQRFRREAEAIARLQHPNIVQIHSIGEQEGRLFLSLEYVEGGTLADRLMGTAMVPHDAARLVADVARAIQFAHEHGILHRDLKPANILLAVDGGQWTVDSDKQSRVQTTDPLPSTVHRPPSTVPLPSTVHRPLSTLLPKISDFGLAKSLTTEHPQTQSGDVLGTPAYMAPEQAAGQAGQIGPASDIYALGAILYETLTGRPPFAGVTPLETILQVVREEPLPIRRLQPKVPRDLEIIVHKCLEKEPGRRYASAGALAEDLQRYLDDLPISARPPSVLYQWRKLARRHKGLVAGAAAVLVSLAAGMTATTIFALSEARQRGLADESARQAEEARNAALGEAYLARIAAAAKALDEHDVMDAAGHLRAAPEMLRDWEWHYLHARLDESLAVVSGLEQAVLFPPGSGVVTVKERKVRLLDALTGALIRELPDGDRVFTASTRNGPLLFIDQDAGPLTLIDEAGKTLWSLSVSAKKRTYSVAVTPDGKRLAALCERGGEIVILLADLTEQSKSVTPLQAVNGIVRLAFSPDGARLAGYAPGAGTDTRHASAWQEVLEGAGKGEIVRLFSGQGEDMLTCLAYSPDGKHVTAGSWLQTVRIAEVVRGREVASRRGHVGTVNDVAYSPDGHWIASGGEDGTVRLWSAEGDQETKVLHGHTSSVYKVAFSPDGTRLASLDASGTARVWTTLVDRNVLRRHTSYVYPVVFSPDGRWFATGAWDSTARLWDTASGATIAVLRTPDAYPAALAVNADSTRLVAALTDNTLRIWDVASREQIASLPQRVIYSYDLRHQIAISPDGSLLAAGTNDRVRIWNLATLNEERSHPVPAVRLVAFSPDGRQLAVVGEGKEISLLDAMTGVEQARCQGHTDFINSLSYSADGSRLLSAGRDRVLRLWDPHTGEAQGTLQGHIAEVFCAVFHPGGTRIASAGRDRAIRLWDATTGLEIIQLKGHADYVFSLAFSPDGRTLVSGSGDTTVRIWDTFSASRVSLDRDFAVPHW
jgi:WD40 repeat protein/serine/threonine protein kinase